MGGLFWHLQERILNTELQVARRIGEFDTSTREASTAAKDVSAWPALIRTWGRPFMGRWPPTLRPRPLPAAGAMAEMDAFAAALDPGAVARR